MTQQLFSIAEKVRFFLEPVWVGWQAERGVRPDILSQSLCGKSSLFLQKVLSENFLFKAEWVSGTPFEDGSGHAACGFRAKDGWQGHAWVEAGEFIVDITADQFGGPPVLVTNINDARYQKGSHDLATPDAQQRRKKAIDIIWPDWTAHRHETQIYSLQFTV